MMEISCPPTVVPRLFAQVLVDAETDVLALALLVIIGVSFYLVVRVRRWRLEEMEKPSLQDQLQSYQRLHEQGLLAPQEYERIRARLEARARPHPELDTSGAAAPWRIPPPNQDGPPSA